MVCALDKKGGPACLVCACYVVHLIRKGDRVGVVVFAIEIVLLIVYIAE